MEINLFTNLTFKIKDAVFVMRTGYSVADIVAEIDFCYFDSDGHGLPRLGCGA